MAAGYTPENYKYAVEHQKLDQLLGELDLFAKEEVVFNKPKRPITDQRAEDQTISYWSHQTNTKDRPESPPIFSSDSPPPFQTVTPPEYHPLPTPSRTPNFSYTAQSSTDQHWWNIGHFDRSTPSQPTIPRTIFQPQLATVYTQSLPTAYTSTSAVQTVSPFQPTATLPVVPTVSNSVSAVTNSLLTVSTASPVLTVVTTPSITSQALTTVPITTVQITPATSTPATSSGRTSQPSTNIFNMSSILKIEKFKGDSSQNAERWLSTFKRYCSFYDLSKEKSAESFPFQLEGHAKIW